MRRGRGRGRGDRADAAALDEAGPGAPPHRPGRRRALPRRCWTTLEVPAERHAELLERLARRDLVGLELQGGRARAGRATPRDAAGPPARDARRARDAGRAPRGRRARRSTACATLYAALEERGVADRVILDLGLVRMLGYYTGAVYEVYDPAVGFTLGGGGRYDDLIGRFGAPRPACGVGAGRPARAHRAGRRGAAGDEPPGLTHRRAARRAVRRHARPARRARRRHRRGALERPQAAVRGRRAS